MPSRRIEDLCPELQPIALKFVEQCAEAGIDAMIYCTWRGDDEQNKAVAEGKSKLKFPNSKHNCVDSEGKPASRAFDAVPMQGNNCLWRDVSKYNRMGKIARDLGLEWGGDWKSFPDKPHFQLKD